MGFSSSCRCRKCRIYDVACLHSAAARGPSGAACFPSAALRGPAIPIPGQTPGKSVLCGTCEAPSGGCARPCGARTPARGAGDGPWPHPPCRAWRDFAAFPHRNAPGWRDFTVGANPYDADCQLLPDFPMGRRLSGWHHHQTPPSLWEKHRDSPNETKPTWPLTKYRNPIPTP